MTALGRAALITCIALFLEGFALYLASRLVANATRLPDAAIPLAIAMLAVGWAFLLSWYVQTIRFSLNLRGIIGLLLSAVSVLVLAGLSMGAGWFPIGLVWSGDLPAIAALTMATVFMLLLWWRGTAIARDDVTLDVVRNAFIRGVVIVIFAVAADPLIEARIISLPVLTLYFAIGLVGLALCRFAAEGGVGRMNQGWMLAILASVGVVLCLALILGAAGVGGLDDAARAIVRGVAFLGLWTLRPFLLLLGLIAAGMVAIGNWVSSLFGGGDLSGLEMARLQIQEFHESLREVESGGPPNVILTLIKWLAFIVAVSVAGWALYRMFRRRRLVGGNYAEGETRESTFTLQGAGQDVADALGGWMNWAGNLRRRRPPPTNPREVYHRMLEIARTVGFPRRTGQTPQEHRRDANQALPDPPIGRIVGGFQRYYYGPERNEPDPGTMADLINDLEDLRPRQP
ncbi:MAG: DUF4129 domain-containing protein [Chloroflexi bacterium]|nr:DUF4129 domain-containing protein [Chloroflexota bacterium]MYD48324.1 DUF4129 domain-containing protein [Chloroflexota bacterium]